VDLTYRPLRGAKAERWEKEARTEEKEARVSILSDRGPETENKRRNRRRDPSRNLLGENSIMRKGSDNNAIKQWNSKLILRGSASK